MAALRHHSFGRIVVAALFACVTLGGMAQTLARPGWMYAGTATEPWWRNAVFYRIEPEHFQDSDGDGRGDLPGIAERLEYLQALGVDAVVLQMPFDDKGFDDLLAEASKRHLRLIIGLDRSSQQASSPQAPRNPEQLTAEARQWLSRGAGGILLPAAPGASAASEDTLRRALRRIAADYPGERVVIVSPPPPGSSSGGSIASDASVVSAAHGGTRSQGPDAPQLVLSTLSFPGTDDVLSPSGVMAALTASIPGTGAPLLASFSAGASKARDAATHASSSARIAAAVLLTHRGALLLEYGQELGEPMPERMPWTPSNVTSTPKPPASTEGAPAPPAPIVYGPYRPYVPPPAKPRASAPSGEPAVSATSSMPDADTLPGFSTQHPPADLPPAPVASVALQERDPHSLLSLYRTLLALHHGNATLRNGNFTLLRSDDKDAVIWLRRAPAGVRTAASVLLAVNCGERTVTLSLASALAELRLQGDGVRSLLPGNTVDAAVSGDRVSLAPHAIFVGELTLRR